MDRLELNASECIAVSAREKRQEAHVFLRLF